MAVTEITWKKNDTDTIPETVSIAALFRTDIFRKHF